MPPIVIKPGAVTTIGSFPGTDIWETSAVVRGEIPDLPMLPELPARGPGADMIGRTLAMLAGSVSSEFAAATTSDGWRISGQLSAELPRQMRRGRAWLGEDLDAAQAEWAEYSGPFKVQVVGPWTLAASVEAANGERLLGDRGAVRELAAGLAELAAVHLAEVRRRLPNAALVMQWDEPGLPAVLAGRLRTQSGWQVHLPVPEPEVKEVLAGVVAAAHQSGAGSAIHCCGTRPPIDLLRGSGAQIVSVDLTLRQTPADDEAFGELLDSGCLLMAGLVDPFAPKQWERTAKVLAPLLQLLNRLGVPTEEAVKQLVLSPGCGLAGCGSMAAVRPVIDALTQAGLALRDEQSALEEER